jgi:carbamoyltransferase
MYVYHVVLASRIFTMEHAYWGSEYPVSQMAADIKKSGFPYEEFDDDGPLLDRAVDTLLDSKVIAWYRGRFEWGPRALGHRSIIADPRRDEMKEIVNTKIKFREPFRPFAPVVMEDKVTDYFSSPGMDKQYPPRYMLMVSDIPADKWDKIQAVCHNGTGRLQTVREEWNSGYYNLIKKFDQATGVPLRVNTSSTCAASDCHHSRRREHLCASVLTMVMGPFW